MQPVENTEDTNLENHVVPKLVPSEPENGLKTTQQFYSEGMLKAIEFDTDLKRIVTIWPGLPESAKKYVLAIVWEADRQSY